MAQLPSSSTLAVLILLASSHHAWSAAAVPVRPGEVLVIQRAERPLNAGRRGIATAPELAGLLAIHGIVEAIPIGPVRAGETPAFLKLISARPDFDPWRAARELESSGLVVAAAPNALLEFFTTFPNDSDLARQWHVHDPGDADMDLPEAWSVSRGGASVRIGVLDTGVDLGHPDLQDRIWTNPDEIAANGIDDDHNGWVDDVHGYDVGDHDPDPTPIPYYEGEDMSYHGTMIAGIAAASTDNAIGVAGADWNARIVPIKITTAPGYLTLEAITEAFRYAWINRLDVVNLSFGGPSGFQGFFQPLVDSARVAGVMCVAAAGNNGTSDIMYPAGCDSVLSVGNSDRRNQRSSTSSWGPWVEVTAPGDSIWAPNQRAYAVDTASASWFRDQRGWDGVRPYMYGWGTSFSAPLVAGICAMVRARAPGLDPLAVRQHIIDTADPMTFDHPMGPKVNAWRALVTLPVTAVSGRTETPLDARAMPTPFRDRVRLVFRDPGGAPATIGIHDVRGRRVAGALLPQSSGERSWAWDGRTSEGRRAPVGVYFMQVRTRGGTTVIRSVRID